MNAKPVATIVTVTKTGGGWTKGDKQCSVHGTGFSAGCLVCRSLPLLTTTKG